MSFILRIFVSGNKLKRRIVMNDDKAVIKKLVRNEDIRSQKIGEGREFKVLSVQGSKRYLGYKESPIYIKIDSMPEDLTGSLLRGGNYLFYVDDAHEQGGFIRMYLFADEIFRSVDRRNFPQKLIEVC